MGNVIVYVLFIVLLPFCVYRGYLEITALRQFVRAEKEKKGNK